MPFWKTVLAVALLPALCCSEETHLSRLDEAQDFLDRELALAEARARQESVRLVERSMQSSPVNELELQGGSGSVTRLLETTSSSPSGVSRDVTTYDWCDCSTGMSSVTIWPGSDKTQNVTINTNSTQWVRFSKTVTSISWSCNGQSRMHSTSVKLAQGHWLSLLIYPEPKSGPLHLSQLCGKPTGRLHWNTWKKTPFVSSAPFTSKTEGYACFKIPALMWSSTGTLIAFSEARGPTCSDYAQTDLVYKRSTDGGRSWEPLSVLVNIPADKRASQGICGHPLVIGNVAPVQLSKDSKYPNRILAPHNRNNFETWLTYSDDDGVTWSEAVKIHGPSQQPDCSRNMSYFGFDIDKIDLKHTRDFLKFAAKLCNGHNNPFSTASWTDKLTGPWQWVGVGPPGSLQLKSGRLLIPSYHSYIRGLAGDGVLPISQLYNNLAKGHVLSSNDFGDSWTVGTEWPLGQGVDENQLVLLKNGSVLTNSRSLSTGSQQFRVQARSDDDGQTFTASTPIAIPQPFNGCQGSTVGASNPESFAGSDTLFVANPDPSASTSILQKAVNLMRCSLKLTGRDRVSVWKSMDGGGTFPEKTLIDPGLSAQTSLQYRDGKLMLLYEQADPEPLNPSSSATEALLDNLVVLLPTRLVLREVVIQEDQVTIV